MPGGSSDSISLRPPRPPVTLTLRVICPAPQDMVPEMANDFWQESIDVGGAQPGMAKPKPHIF